MGAFARHRTRIAVTLAPVLLALLHATGALPLPLLHRLDHILYDVRLRATMPRTLDDRIVIVDIDEKSLAEVGRWPWSRDRMAKLAQELFDRQQVAVAGFDVVFAEADDSSGLKRLRQLAQGELRNQAGFVQRLEQLAPSLDHDARFAQALAGRPAVLGYYFTSDRDAGASGRLPAPVMRRQELGGQPLRLPPWQGYGANIESLASAAPTAGFFNSIADADGTIRSLPLLAEYRDEFHESLPLAMFRVLAGRPAVEMAFASGAADYLALESVMLKIGSTRLALPVDERAAALVPYRGPGGPRGGSFRYVSAADLLAGRVAPGTLGGRIVLVGTTAPGLQDLRATPVGETYPGVETHANLISGMLDGRLLLRPDYAVGYDVAVLLAAGLLLAFSLPLVSALAAVMTSVAVLAAVTAANLWLYASLGLVLPLAAALAMVITAFALNMSYGYVVESRSKRELATLFGTYVPPELVREMVRNPDSYSMKAESRELTVMFCDMRGFTGMSEQMGPVQLQELLNAVFNRLTDVIRANRGTVDKYMGDCVMAFWGAPVETADHAHRAVKCAMEMVAAVEGINEDHRAKGLPPIGVGVGLNTGMMCVGDMGSQVRRSYTVIGDAVNVGARLEGLSRVYGVDIVASGSTRAQAPGFAWQELDRVRVKGKEQAVAIFQPLGPAGHLEPSVAGELRDWETSLQAYRRQDWDRCQALLAELALANPEKSLYELYSQRVASKRLLPRDHAWDGATTFETK